MKKCRSCSPEMKPTPRCPSSNELIRAFGASAHPVFAVDAAIDAYGVARRPIHRAARSRPSTASALDVCEHHQRAVLHQQNDPIRRPELRRSMAYSTAKVGARDKLPKQVGRPKHRPRSTSRNLNLGAAQPAEVGRSRAPEPADLYVRSIVDSAARTSYPFPSRTPSSAITATDNRPTRVRHEAVTHPRPY